MTTTELRPWFGAHWPEVRHRLDAGTYRPRPVRQVKIPKPGGGVRTLGVPTVVDRLICQAILQVLTPVFDPGFSQWSFGFRPRRSAHQAVEAARGLIEAGGAWVVDVDLESFFDRVNHDALMARVARRVGDRRVLKLIRRSLEAGTMGAEVVVEHEAGTPQGSPLSPSSPTSCSTTWTTSWSGGATGSSATPTTSGSTSGPSGQRKGSSMG
jgi:group II intron reverse transcriptase/maturase